MNQYTGVKLFRPVTWLPVLGVPRDEARDWLRYPCLTRDEVRCALLDGIMPPNLVLEYQGGYWIVAGWGAYGRGGRQWLLPHFGTIEIGGRHDRNPRTLQRAPKP